MKVLVIPSWYPDENDKLLGIYHKEYATAISNNNIDVDMLYISRIGISKIFKYPFMMKKQIDNEKTYKVYKYRMLDISKISKKLQLKLYAKKLETFYKDYLKLNTKPDIIHSMVTLPSGYACAKLGKKYNIPVLVTEHSSNYYQYFKGINKKFGEYVLKNTTFSTVSNYMKNELNLDKCYVIPNIVDTKIFNIKKHKNNKSLNLVTISAFRIGKNLEDIIKSLSLLIYERNIKNVHLDIIGDGYLMSYLKEISKELNVYDYITFHGKKTKEEISKILSKNDIFIVASKLETFCIPGIEALAASLPVVSSKCKGPEEYIDRKSGELFEVGNINEMCDKIIKVSKNLDKYDSKYLKSIANNYSYKNVSKLAKNIYEEILKDHKNKKH